MLTKISSEEITDGRKERVTATRRYSNFTG